MFSLRIIVWNWNEGNKKCIKNYDYDVECVFVFFVVFCGNGENCLERRRKEWTEDRSIEANEKKLFIIRLPYVDRLNALRCECLEKMRCEMMRVFFLSRWWMAWSVDGKDARGEDELNDFIVIGFGLGPVSAVVVMAVWWTKMNSRFFLPFLIRHTRTNPPRTPWRRSLSENIFPDRDR